MGPFALLRRASAQTRALVAIALSLSACTSSVGGAISTGGEGGGAPCGSCYDVFINGGIACGPGDSADAWHELASCACGLGPCAGACTASFCASLPVTGPAPGDSTDTCSTCLGMTCGSQLANCASN